LQLDLRQKRNSRSRSEGLQNEGWTLFMAIVHWRQRGIHVERLQPLAAENSDSTSQMRPRSTGATLANMSLLLTTGSSPPARTLSKSTSEPRSLTHRVGLS